MSIMTRARARQRHGAGFLAGEETIHYAFHPLAGKTVASTGRRVVYGGVEHITIRLIDGTMTLTPAWMMRPEAATCAIRPGPRLSTGSGFPCSAFEKVIEKTKLRKMGRRCAEF